MQLKINEQLKALIPPLSQDEYTLLEQSIINEGCRDKIITWDDTIIDGHNRYEICTRHGIPFQTEDRDFESIADVRVWMITNQFGRRNINNYQRSILALELEEVYREKAKENQGKRTDICQKSDESIKPIDTKKELAKLAHVSHDTIAKVKAIQEKAPIEVKEKLKAGDVSINQAYKEIKQEEKKERFIQKKKEFEQEVKESLTITECYNGSCLDYLKKFDKDIDLVLTDPPYAMDFKSGWNDWDKIEGDKRQDTIPLLDECFALLKSKMKSDAHIYVFGNPYEIENVKPIFQKYFNLKNILIWDRKVIGMGDLKTYGRSYDIIYFGYNEVWKDLNGTRDKDILEFNRVNPNELIHPTEKPLEILKYLIKKSSKENDVVFDPFAGSCSTLIASKETGRNAYGAELETKYIPEWILKKI